MAFFASPAKPWLIKQLNQRAAAASAGKADRAKNLAKEQLKSVDGKEEEPVLGLPPDPEHFDAIVQEVREDIEAMHKMGFRRAEAMPSEKAKSS